MRILRSAVLATFALLLAPAFAHADPPPIFTQEEQCDTTRALVDNIRASKPDATPEEIADAFVNYMDSMGAYNRVPQAKESDRQVTLTNIERCGLA
ncbi:hypothetical protein [Nocardia fluminea]|uniref:Hemophore-related protein n=1 Tax=Nocardia fluminea TaxID=134984 RepID=A0A2N3VC17_9NOCA|nr:hypothetical protein [Nocardia fluminea]PKV79159.1 hypothetical protein ATK86_3545 [Nocardia fluminea]